MLGDTFVLPQAGGDITLKKINQDGYSSEYYVRAADGLSEYSVRIRHTKTNATSVRPSYDRHNVEVVQTVYQAGDVQQYDRKMYFVIERKPSDSGIALYDALADKVILSSNALLVGLLNRES
jgi:nitrogenase subunit NifH